MGVGAEVDGVEAEVGGVEAEVGAEVGGVGAEVGAVGGETAVVGAEVGVGAEIIVSKLVTEGVEVGELFVVKVEDVFMSIIGLNVF